MYHYSSDKGAGEQITHNRLPVCVAHPSSISLSMRLSFCVPLLLLLRSSNGFFEHALALYMNILLVRRASTYTDSESQQTKHSTKLIAASANVLMSAASVQSDIPYICCKIYHTTVTLFDVLPSSCWQLALQDDSLLLLCITISTSVHHTTSDACQLLPVATRQSIRMLSTCRVMSDCCAAVQMSEPTQCYLSHRLISVIYIQRAHSTWSCALLSDLFEMSRGRCKQCSTSQLH
eukprot:7391-Heterococcus_DN1.PRE.2